MINECPCKGCAKRKVGCHGYCIDYKKWQKVARALSLKEKEARNKQIGYIDWNCRSKY